MGRETILRPDCAETDFGAVMFSTIITCYLVYMSNKYGRFQHGWNEMNGYFIFSNHMPVVLVLYEVNRGNIFPSPACKSLLDFVL